MKLSHAIILIALLTGQYASLANASTSANVICQFDKSTMIKQKLKKAQECINNGNSSGAKNYLNGVLKLDASNTTDMSNLKMASEKYGHVKYACVTNRGLVVVCERFFFYSNIPTNLEVALKSITFRPDKVVFTDSGTYLITNENESYNYNM